MQLASGYVPAAGLYAAAKLKIANLLAGGSRVRLKHHPHFA
jgi:hypothetical protein